MEEPDFIPYEAVRSLGPGPVLVFAPHPDDEIFGCGGAILRHLEAGDLVQVVVLTEGEVYPGERRAESAAAAAVLGYGLPEHWGYGDRGLRYGEALVRHMLAAIEQSGARSIYAPSVHEIHPDHRAAAMAAVEAVRRAGGERWLLMYEVGVAQPANRLLDITDLYERKLRAVECFQSQLARHRYADFFAGLSRYRAYTLPPEVVAAEAYQVVPAAEISANLTKLYQSLARRHSAGEPFPDRPLVSVVVRTLGRPELQDALESIALQTHPRVEVVVVDAAGEGRLELGEWCGPFPLRTVCAGEPLPRARAANLGLREAAGEYRMLLDDDDLMDPDHIAGLLELLAGSPGCRAAYAGVRVEGPPGEGRPLLGIFNEPFNGRRLVYENYLPIHAVLFHRELAEGCDFDEQLEVYEDWDFWIRLSIKGSFVHHDRITATYRSAGGSRVSLFKEDQETVREQRSRLYAKWLACWQPRDIDAIFEEYRHARHDLLQRQSGLRQQLDSAREREAGLHQEIIAVNADRAELNRRLQEAGEVYAQVAAERDALRVELASLHQSAQKQREALQSDIAVLKAGEQQMRTTLDETRDTLDAVLGSTAWRLTAPMRWALTMLRRRG